MRPKINILNLKQIDEISKKYNTPYDEAVLMQLNLTTSINSCTPNTLAKVFLDKNKTTSVLYFKEIEGVCSADEDYIYLYGEKALKKLPFEKKDFQKTKFGNARGNVVSLDSNYTSNCSSCLFCERDNTLNYCYDSNNIHHISAEMNKFQENLTIDFAKLKEIVIVTSCFPNEKKTVDHMINVSKVAQNMGFKGTLGILSSSITSKEGLRRIGDNIEKPKILFTLECLDNREKIVSKNKLKLNSNDIKQIMENENSNGILSSFCHIIGLDSIQKVVENAETLLPYTNFFPNFHVIRRHNEKIDPFLQSDALSLEFMLKSRQSLENVYKSTKLRPDIQRTINSLWYNNFDNTPLSSYFEL
jgi:hypothetical protein